MVDTEQHQLKAAKPLSAYGGSSRRRAQFGHLVLPMIWLAILIAGGLAVIFAPRGGTQTDRPATPRANTSAVMHALAFSSDHHINATKSAGTIALDSPASPSSVASSPVSVPMVSTAVPVPVVAPSISTLVTQVEAFGVEPGSNWTWSIGDTSTHCGVVSGVGTGCTYGEAGREYTIFAGTPTLALVAHELANAETQNDAIPSLLSQTATAAAGTSWSPTDAVASCLVAHFMGFQDDAAGSWQCSASLATSVAAHIHDTY